MTKILCSAMPLVDCLPSLRVGSAGTLCLGLALLLTMAAPVQAQDSNPSRQEKMTHYSLYYENFKNDNFELARADLLWILENSPGFDSGNDKNYRRAVELYEGLAEQASNEKERTAYLDTAATYLTTAVDSLEKHGLSYSAYKWERRKGRFLEKHRGSLSEDIPLKEDAVTYYRRAFDLAPEELNPYYVRRILESYLQDNDLKKALTFANKVEEVRGDDEEVAKILRSERKKIFSKNPQARIAHLEEQLEQAPDSIPLMTELFNAYVNRGNIESASELAARLMESNPSAETVRQIAEMRLDDGRPQEAIEAYDRAEKQGADLKAQDHFNRGEALAELGNFPEARGAYRQALELQPDFGEAYIAIGDLYTRAVSECSGGSLERTDKAVYWVAVDKYRRAREVDSSVASMANNKINTFRKYFPTREDIFYRDNWEAGAEVTVNSGCYSWINETTTVREAAS